MILTLGLLGVASGVAWYRAAIGSRAAAVPAIAPLAASSPLRARSIPGSGGAVVVYVAGEVARPGVYRLPAGARAEAAIRAAGGLRPGADPVAVNLAQRVEDGEEIAVPAPGEAARPARGAGEFSRSGRKRRRRLHGAAGRAGRARKAPEQPVDLNSADAATLETLPGIGPELAARIVEFREANGPFASLDDLLDVAGTSPRLIDELQPYALAGAR